MRGIGPVTLLSALSFAAPVAAEGLELTFGVGIRAETESNPAFDDSGRVSKTGLFLSFGLVSETALSKLELGASGRILSTQGPGSPVSGLNAPTVTLAYTRTGANAEFRVNGAVTDTDLASNTAVDNFTVGRGTERAAQISVALDMGKDAPFGYGLQAGVAVQSYPDNPDNLVGNRVTTLGATARADLSPVLHLNLGLSDSRFTQPGISRDTLGLSAGLVLDRPTGTLSATLRNDHTPDGDRTGLNFGHEMTLPSGTLSYDLGATRGALGDVYATGAIRYAQDLPTGALTLGLERQVTADADTDAEILQSSANIGYTRAVTPNANLAFALNWAEQQSTVPGATTSANSSLSATWTQDLTADWALDLGYTHRLRDQAGTRGDSDAIHVELRRSFTVRP